MQLAKLSFNHSNGRTHSWRFSKTFFFFELRQLWVRPMGGWNSTLQAAWYVRHAHWACLCYVPIEIWCTWYVSYISTIWLFYWSSSTSFFYGRPFARVLYLFLVDRYRSVTPLSVTRVNRTILHLDDVVHNHSAHGHYITRMEGGVRYARYCCYTLSRIKQNWAKTAIHKNWIWLHFIYNTIWVMRRAKSMYVYDVKTQKGQVLPVVKKYFV